MDVINLLQATLSEVEGPDGFRIADRDVGEAVGAERLAAYVTDLPPGQRMCPYHWEAAQEEWLLVLTGAPTVRTPEGERTLEPGDVVCFRRGPDGAHAVGNDTDDPCRVLMLSDRAETNVIVYPDSGKVGARTAWLRPNFPADAEVGYWAGETEGAA